MFGINIVFGTGIVFGMSIMFGTNIVFGLALNKKNGKIYNKYEKHP